MLSCGSPRFTRLVTLVNVASTFTPSRSATGNRLLAPAFQLNEPGPSMIPTPELPNRPRGAGSRPGTTPTLQLNGVEPAVRPGQTNALRSSHRAAVGLAALPAPMRSGRCVPRLG